MADDLNVIERFRAIIQKVVTQGLQQMEKLVTSITKGLGGYFKGMQAATQATNASTQSFMQWIKGGTQMAGLLRGFLYEGLSLVAEAIADKLSPSMDHLTGGFHRNTEAQRKLEEQTQRSALAFERGQESVRKYTQVFTNLTTGVKGAFEPFQEFLGSLAEGIAVVLRIGATVGSLAAILGIATYALAKIGIVIPTATAAFAALLSPVGLVTVAVLGSALALGKLESHLRQQRGSIDEAISKFKEGSDAARQLGEQLDVMVTSWRNQSDSARDSIEAQAALARGDAETFDRLQKEITARDALLQRKKENIELDNMIRQTGANLTEGEKNDLREILKTRQVQQEIVRLKEQEKRLAESRSIVLQRQLELREIRAVIEAMKELRAMREAMSAQDEKKVRELGGQRAQRELDQLNAQATREIDAIRQRAIKEELSPAQTDVLFRKQRQKFLEELEELKFRNEKRTDQELLQVRSGQQDEKELRDRINSMKDLRAMEEAIAGENAKSVAEIQKRIDQRDVENREAREFLELQAKWAEEGADYTEEKQKQMVLALEQEQAEKRIVAELETQRKILLGQLAIDESRLAKMKSAEGLRSAVEGRAIPEALARGDAEQASQVRTRIALRQLELKQADERIQKEKELAAAGQSVSEENKNLQRSQLEQAHAEERHLQAVEAGRAALQDRADLVDREVAKVELLAQMEDKRAAVIGEAKDRQLRALEREFQAAQAIDAPTSRLLEIQDKMTKTLMEQHRIQVAQAEVQQRAAEARQEMREREFSERAPLSEADAESEIQDLLNERVIVEGRIESARQRTASVSGQERIQAEAILEVLEKTAATIESRIGEVTERTTSEYREQHSIQGAQLMNGRLELQLGRQQLETLRQETPLQQKLLAIAQQKTALARQEVSAREELRRAEETVKRAEGRFDPEREFKNARARFVMKRSDTTEAGQTEAKQALEDMMRYAAESGDEWLQTMAARAQRSYSRGTLSRLQSDKQRLAESERAALVDSENAAKNVGNNIGSWLPKIDAAVTKLQNYRAEWERLARAVEAAPGSLPIGGANGGNGLTGSPNGLSTSPPVGGANPYDASDVTLTPNSGGTGIDSLGSGVGAGNNPFLGPTVGEQSRGVTF